MGRFSEAFLNLFSNLTTKDLDKECLKGQVSKLIIEQRRELKMNKSSFAKLLNVDKESLSNYESFSYNFTLDELSNIFSKLNKRIIISTEGGCNEE